MNQALSTIGAIALFVGACAILWVVAAITLTIHRARVNRKAFEQRLSEIPEVSNFHSPTHSSGGQHDHVIG